MNFIFLGHQLLSVTGEAFCKTVKKPDEKGAYFDMRHGYKTANANKRARSEFSMTRSQRRPKGV
jgi:hypothetical protein